MNDLSKIVFAPSSKESILINNPMSAIINECDIRKCCLNQSKVNCSSLEKELNQMF